MRISRNFGISINRALTGGVVKTAEPKITQLTIDKAKKSASG
jgi:hypothetical protein